jgi:ketosteroid isomerase-like protein
MTTGPNRSEERVTRERKFMSDQTNVAVLQQGYEAFGRWDIPAVLELLTDDVEWTMQGPSVIPYAGTFRGREGVAEFFSLLDETIEFEQFEPRKFIGQGDTVVVLGYERDVVKETGRGFEEEWAHVYTLRDGKIATGLFLEDTAALVDALSAG